MIRSIRGAASVVSILVTIVLGLAAGAAGAQTFPSKPLTLLVPFAAGGPADIVSRVTAQEVSKILGQPVVVDNRVGASGKIAIQALLRAPRDGYTVAYISPTIMTINPLIDKDVGYEPLKDIQPLTTSLRGGNVLVVYPGRGFKSIQEFVAYAKANPGKLNYGSYGMGSSLHLYTERLLQTLKIKATHIPYKGEAQILNDLMAGGLDFMIASGAAKPYIDNGKLWVLGATGASRATLFPQVPTLQESGLKELAQYSEIPWLGFGVASGVPADVVVKLHDVFAKALRSDDVRNRLSIFGDVAPSSPHEISSIIKAELDANRELLRTLKLD